MSSTDNRIVKMIFDNAAFKRAAEETKSAITSVNDAITKAGKSPGLLNVTKDMQNVAIHASKMQVATASAIATIASKATAMGIGLAKSLTFDPIKQGFQEYGELLTKQNAIMNSTGKDAKTVKDVLNTLNTYSDRTIFKFSDMTQALTKFTNAGVGLKASAKTIEGVGNAAAYAGLTSEKAGAAFYAVAQVMETGFLQGNDLMQLNNAGFATQRFKTEVIKAAESVGTLRKQGDHWITKTGKLVTAGKGFKDNLKEQWATADAVNIALTKYTKTGTKLGDAAIKSATQVRTFSAFMGTLKESLGSGWAQVFGAMFGGLDEATSMWTSLSLAIGKVVSGFFSFLSSSIQVWRDMGGAAKIGKTLKNVLSPFGALFKAIGDAWHAAFGTSGGKGMGSTLYGVSVALELLTRPLTWLAWIISQLVHPLTIFFMIIKLGGLVIGRLIGYAVDFVKSLFDLTSFKAPGNGAGTFIGWIKNIFTEVERALGVIISLIDEGVSLKDAFKAIGDIDLKFPKMPKFPELPDWMKGILPDTIELPGIGGFKLPKIGNLFGGGDSEKKSGPQEMSARVMELASNTSTLDTVMKGLSEKSLSTLDTVMKGLSEKSFPKLDDVMKGLSENSILGGGKGEFEGVVNLRQLENGTEIATKAMSNAKDAGNSFWGMIKNIGSAIGDFFGLIEGEDIVTSLNFALLATTGLTAFQMFKNFSDVLGGVSDVIKGFKKVGPALTGTIKDAGSALKAFQTQARAELIKQIAIALVLLAAALFLLSLIPRDKMMTALMGLGGAVAALGVVMFIFTKTLDKMDKKGTTAKLYALGFAIMAVGLALLFMAAAMIIFNYVDPDSVKKALITLGVVFTGMIAIGRLAEKSGRKLVAAGVSMVLIGGALIILATGLLLFKLVDTESMQKAGAVIGVLVASLLLLGLVPAMRLMNAGKAILAISVAMLILANALIIFEKVEWESIGKAGAVLAGLTLALILMSAMGVKGAAVILAVGAAMLMIAMACLAFEKVSWTAIAMAAVVLYLIVGALAALLILVTGFAPAVVLLTTLALGLAALAAAGALLAFAIALIVPLLGTAAVGIVIFAAAVAVAIATFLQTLALEMPNIKKALLKILDELVKFLIAAVPIVVQGVTDIIEAIAKKAPEYVEAGVHLILALIEGIANSLDDIVKAAVDLILKFLDAIIEGADDLIDGGIELIEKLMKGLIDHQEHLLQTGVDVIVHLLEGLARMMRDSGGAIGTAIGDVIAAFAEFGAELINGIARGMGEAARTANPIQMGVNFARGFISGAKGPEGADARSPSRKMIEVGKFLVLGLVVGVQAYAALAINTVASLVSGQIAIASEYISKFAQKMDQQAIAARAKAEGLAAAADIASASAEKTKKNEKDDAAADKLSKRAESASTKADKAEEAAEKAKDKANRRQEFVEAATLDKAKMKSEDAQTAIDDAKAAEGRAATALTAAKALGQQIKSGKYSAAEEKKMQAKADALRKEAAKEAALANAFMAEAKKNTAQALTLQKQAGAEAALAYQKQFEDAAREDAESDAFDAMSDTEKAVKRRADAAALQAAAADNLAKAKALAYTDVEAANELAGIALDQADRARDYLKDAIGYEKAVAEAAKAALDAAAEVVPEVIETTPEVNPTIDLTASDQAAIAFANLADLYSSATAAAAAGSTVEFNQYNTSPEALSPTEVYRQTNNLLTHAYTKLGQAA